MTTLMACMAAIPCAGGRLPSAFMMVVENTMKTPATSPAPMAETSVSVSRALRMSRVPRPRGGGVFYEASEVASLPAQRATDTVGHRGVAAVEHFGKQIRDEGDRRRRHVRVVQGGDVRIKRHFDVSNIATSRARDLTHGLRECPQFRGQ